MPEQPPYSSPSPFSESTGGFGQSTTAQQRWQAPERYKYPTYLVRRKLLKLVGAAFYVDDPNGNVIMYANQKGFKLKEDIRLYTGEDMTTELLRIGARNWLDFSATYDVTDATTGEKVGALRRKGMKSTFLQDEWSFLDAQDREIGMIKEDSLVLALIRRFVDFAALFLPQKFTGTIGNREVAEYTQTKNPLLIKLQCNFAMDGEGVLDRRLGLAAAILLCAIEGKQRGA